jgi:hypothetical protein
LRELAVDEIASWQQMALVRLHLWVTGETHRLLIAFLDKLRPELDRAADSEGNLAFLSGPGLQMAATDYWASFVGDWLEMVQAARRHAAWIPFGQLARLHLHYLEALNGVTERRVREAGPSVAIGYPDEPGPPDAIRSFVFDRAPFIVSAMQARIDGILFDAEAIRYSDGKKFSDRVWNLQNGGLIGMLDILGLATAEGRSAWDTARQLEEHLGIGTDCPRWTKTRLYTLTKTDIALGDTTGLIRNPCDTRGVAYDALRLARNEIQIVHHIATDRAFAAMPWVEKEQVVLSPSHPPIGCECEDVVVGGEKGEGIYAKGEIVLPIHVQCLCFKVAILMDEDEFVRRMRGWMAGTAPWAEMDTYAGFLGFSAADLGDTAGIAGTALAAAPLAAWLVTWAQGEVGDLEDALDVAIGDEVGWAIEQLPLFGSDEEAA